MKNVIIIIIHIICVIGYSQKIPFGDYNLGDSYATVKEAEQSKELKIIKDVKDVQLSIYGKIALLPSEDKFSVIHKFISGKLNSVDFFVITDISTNYGILKKELYKIYGMPKEENLLSNKFEIQGCTTIWDFPKYTVNLSIQEKSTVKLKLRIINKK